MKSLKPTDKKKSKLDILVDAEMNIRARMTEPVKYEKILKAVSEWYEVDWMSWTNDCKKNVLTKEQRVCIYLMYELSNLESDEIAKVMGQKDSINVIRSTERTIADMRRDEKLRKEVLEIVEKMK